MEFDALYYPYPSRRMIAYGRNGMVATSQYLAAQAGVDILKKGGNAIDAALAAAACLTVVEPNKNGIGGDCFALIWYNHKLYGLNASGPAPMAINAELVRNLGYKSMPEHGWIPVTVPGAPAGWAAMNKRFGSLAMTSVMESAIRYAEEGFPVSPTVSSSWKRLFRTYSMKLKGEQYHSWFDTFAPKAHAPGPGEIWRSPDHAKTLQSIAESNGESFYRGILAEKIENYSRKYKGFLRQEDLARYVPEWVEPIKTGYRGYDVWEMPPNGQGIVALIALNILKAFEFSEKESVDTYHKQIEAIKLAFADGKTYVTDPGHMKVKAEDLLSEGYAQEKRKLIGRNAIFPGINKPPKGGTVYLATADKEGNMVSFIQSNYMEFGSGLVVPGTGIALQNRGHCFSLEREHDNCLEPGKRSYHTIIPGFLSRDGKPVGPFGVMGGFMQPQGHLQVVMNMVDFKLNPQAALDAPRWQWMEDKKVSLQYGFPHHFAQSLKERGHDISFNMDYGAFGHGQIILRDDSGVLSGGTEPFTDGAVECF